MGHQAPGVTAAVVRAAHRPPHPFPPPPSRSPQVPVELGLSAHGNATAFFELRRKALAKHAKTLAANEAALAAAEKKAEQQINHVRCPGGQGGKDAPGCCTCLHPHTPGYRRGDS